MELGEDSGGESEVGQPCRLADGGRVLLDSYHWASPSLPHLMTCLWTISVLEMIISYDIVGTLDGRYVVIQLIIICVSHNGGDNSWGSSLASLCHCVLSGLVSRW